MAINLACLTRFSKLFFPLGDSPISSSIKYFPMTELPYDLAFSESRSPSARIEI
jgi:hypothetical protein